MSDSAELRQPGHHNVDVADVGLLLLRVCVGGFAILHGLQQVVLPSDFILVVSGLGVPLPTIGAWLAILGQLGLGFLLILGLFTRAVGVLLAVMFVLVFYTYYVAQSDTALTLTFVGTLRGVESMSYAATGAFFALVGAGGLSVDRLVAGWWRAGPGTSSGHVAGHSARRIAAHAGSLPGPGNRATGLLALRLFIGALLILHGASFAVGNDERRALLVDRLAGLGLPSPTVAAWVTAALMVAVGVVLSSGRWTRAAGILLAAVAAMLFVAIPIRGGTGISGVGGRRVGFHGEEFVFLATVGIFFAASGPGRLALKLRDGQRHAAVG